MLGSSAIQIFRMCGPKRATEWPLWWLRYAVLIPRSGLLAARKGVGSYDAGYACAPLFYNVFGEHFGEAMRQLVVVKRDETGNVLTITGRPFDMGCLAWLAEAEPD